MATRLTKEEAARLTRLLSYGMTVGGWTMIAFAGLAAFIPMLGLLRLISFAEGAGEEGLIGFFTLVLVMAGIGLWMIARGKKRARSILEGDLTEAEAEVNSVSGYRYPMGFYVRFQVTMPLGDTCEGTQRYMGKPPWKAGDRTVVLVSADGRRFFPRNQSIPADFGKISRG